MVANVTSLLVAFLGGIVGGLLGCALVLAWERRRRPLRTHKFLDGAFTFRPANHRFLTRDYSSKPSTEAK
jgi:hypothetical protein